MNRSAHYSRAVAWLFLGMMLTAASAHAQEASFTPQVEARVLALVNDFRGDHSLQPLERESRLDQAAGYFAGYMAGAGRLDHRADGATPAARVKQRGYAYCEIAENIGMEYDSRGFTAERLARSLVEGWRESPTHRAAILDRAATQTGLGVARNAQGEYYAAQVFARPRPVGGKCR